MSGPPLNPKILSPDTLPPCIAAVLANRWSTTFSTVGAVHCSIFTNASIAQRSRDMQEALDVLEKIKTHKQTISTLCQQLVEKLPLELREMVYEHIIPGRSVNFTDPDKRYHMFYGFRDTTARTQPGSEQARDNLSFSSSPPADASRYWKPVRHMFSYQPSPEVVGGQVTKELQDHFHRHARVHLGVMSLDLVTKLISTETFDRSLRKISVSIRVYHDAELPFQHSAKRIELRNTAGLECLDGLAALSGEGIDVIVLVDGVDFNWGGVAGRALITEKGVKEALELVFLRLLALEMKRYKTSLVVDAK